MQGRQFITLLGGAATWPLIVRAQQSKSIKIGILSGFTDPSQNEMRVGPFKEQLRALGWIEGNNMEIDYRQANVGQLRATAEELVASKPDIILAMPAPAMQAIWQITRTIPVVFANVSDPVDSGFVVSLARPDGNATGFTAFEYSLGGKWLELLKEIAPATRRALVLFYQDQYSSRALLKSIQESGAALGIEIDPAPVRSLVDIERAIEQLVHQSGGGLLTAPHTVITNNNRRIFELANKHRLPAVYPFRQYALDGGLVSYGNDEPDAYRHAAGYVTEF